MENYLMLNGKQIELTEEQIAEIKQSFGIGNVLLSSLKAEDTFKIGEYEFFIVDHLCGRTIVGLKDSLFDEKEFGENNNYNGSYVDDICNDFSDKIANIIGEENILPYEVDLTADDGLKDYGIIERKMWLLTANLYRKYVEILDKHKLNKYWWLSTAYSTPTHEDSSWVKCVSPFGLIDFNNYYYYRGVRPFCILNSNIFVSK